MSSPLQSWWYFVCAAQFFFLSYLFSETGVEEDEELYDCVYGEDEGGEVYEDLMKDEAAQQPVCFPVPSCFGTIAVNFLKVEMMSL